MDSSQQPTIVVKKKDGTTVRMTMAEFELYKQSLEGTSAPNTPLSPPAIQEPQAVATTTPVRDVFIHGNRSAAELTSSAVLPRTLPLPVEQSERWYPRAGDVPLAVSSLPKKPVVQDVKPPSSRAAVSPRPKRTMGPVDEIGDMSLRYAKGFASSDGDYTAYLISKFMTLKEESYVLYLEAVAAWRTSPLWHTYERAILESMESGDSLADVLSDTSLQVDGLTMNDILAITKVNMALLL